MLRKLLRRRLLFKGKHRLKDHELDNLFIVDGQPKSLVRSILTSPKVRQMLIKARPLTMKMYNSQIILELLGIETNQISLECLINLVCEIAEKTESYDV